jgi:REP element-mobilizing transposase RayT
MVIAQHIIMTAYGFWLPNDPRGSWSDFVRQWEILLHGEATKTMERRSLARAPHDRQKRLDAKKSLRYDPVEFTGIQARCVGRGFAKAARESGYTIFACSILPSHVHLVVSRHQRLAEKIAGHLKARGTQELVAQSMHPFVEFTDSKGRFLSVWAHRSWKVYLDSYDDIDRAIRYVENNPIKDRKPAQHWSFVTQWTRPQHAPTLVPPRLADPLAGRFPAREK